MKKYIWQNKNIIIPAILILLNIFIKGFFLTENSIAGDEPFSIYHAQMDIVSIIKQLATGNNPPLYELILHFWIKIFGISPLSVRFPSLIFSCITVLFIYKLGKRFFSQEVAIYAGLFFIFSNYQILFAHEARVYALVGMLSVISMYHYLRIIVNHETNSFNVIVFLATNIFLIYSHYFGFFILLIQLVYILLNKELITRYWKKSLLASLIITLFYLPNLEIIISRFLDSTMNGTWIRPVSNLGNLHDVFYMFSNSNTAIYLIFIGLLWFSLARFFYKSNIDNVIKLPLIAVIIPLFFLTSVSIFIGMPLIWKLTSKPAYTIFFLIMMLSLVFFIVFFRQKNNILPQTKIIVFWYWFPFLIMFLISLKYLPVNVPMFHDRYLMFFSIAYYLQLAILSSFIIKRKRLKYIIPIAVIIMYAITTKPNISNKRNVEETINKVKTLKNNQTVVYFCPSWFDMNFIYYYNLKCFKNYNSKSVKANMHKYLTEENIYPINNQSQIDSIQLQEFERILFLDAGADFSFPNNDILQKLKDNAVLENKYEFEEIFMVYEFKIR